MPEARGSLPRCAPQARLDFAAADGRIVVNVAASVKPPSNARKSRREPMFLDLGEVRELAQACKVHRVKDDGVMVDGKPYGDVAHVLGTQGMRFGELAGLKVGDRIAVPGPGIRLQRAVLSSPDTGELYVDTLKSGQARTVPLLSGVVPIFDRWCEGKKPGDWIFDAPNGGMLSEANWKRSVGWIDATTAIGKKGLRVHDLRHSAASIWLADGADPKVVQRILGHASAAMTMDLYGHLFDTNLWDAAKKVGGTTGAFEANDDDDDGTAGAPALV